MSKIKFAIIVIKTHQMNSLREFYSVLSMEFTEHQHGTGPVHFGATVGEILFEVYPLPSEQLPVDITTRLGFTVENIGKVIQILKSKEVSIISEPKETPWGLRALVRDPDGRTIELYQSMD